MTTRNKTNIYQRELGYQKQNQNDDEKFCGPVSLFVPVVDVGIVVVLRLFSLAPRHKLPILLLRLYRILSRLHKYFKHFTFTSFGIIVKNILGRPKIDFRKTFVFFVARIEFIECRD